MAASSSLKLKSLIKLVHCLSVESDIYPHKKVVKLYFSQNLIFKHAFSGNYYFMPVICQPIPV